MRPAPLLALALAALLLPHSALAKDDEVTEKSFLAAYRQAGEDAKKRALAVHSLVDADEDERVSGVLKVLPAEESLDVQRAAVTVLATVRDKKALKPLLKAAGKKRGDWNVRSVTLEALGKIDTPEAVEGLVEIAEDGDDMSSAGALFALAERHPPESKAVALDRLYAAAWQVRLGALEVLAMLKDKDTVPVLADRLDEERGRIAHEVLATLKIIVGKDLGEEPEAWRAWARGEEVAPAGGDAPKKDDAATTSATTDVVKPTYYGEPIVSERIVFVVDVSLSMNEEMKIDREKLVRETGAVVSGGEGEQSDPKKNKDDGEVQAIEWWKIRTRKDFAIAQLKYAISTLGRDQLFDVVWYSDSVKAWKGQMVPAHPRVKLQASAWLDEIELEGGTNTWGGLAKALNLVGKGTDLENYSRGADTIYFMSDGQPSVGDIVETDAIIEALKRIHKVRRVKIHVAQIGTSPLPFMKGIAAATGGQYRFFKAGEPKNLPK